MPTAAKAERILVLCVDRDDDLDIVISGSQKAFMLPPGLAFLGLSERARHFADSATSPRYYFDLAKELKNQPNDQTAYTPAVTLLVGLAEALRIILDEAWSTEQIELAARIEAEIIGVGQEGLTAAAVHTAHARGLDVWVWTVNEPGRGAELRAMGVDGLISDRVGMMP